MVHSQSQLETLSAAAAPSQVFHQTESIRPNDDTKAVKDNISSLAGFGTTSLGDIRKLNESKSSDLSGTGLPEVPDFLKDYEQLFPEFSGFGTANHAEKTPVGEASKHDGTKADHFSLDGKVSGDNPVGNKAKAVPNIPGRSETAAPILGKADLTHHSIATGMAAALMAQQEAAKAQPGAQTNHNHNRQHVIRRSR